MALGDIQIMQEGFAERGLGTSPFASRRIQQMDISKLKDLRAQVAESQTRSEALAKQRNLSLIQQMIQNQNNIIGGVEGAGRGGAGQPMITIEGMRTSTPGGVPVRGYRLLAPTGSGAQVEERMFQSLGELSAFLKANPEIASSVVTGGIGLGQGSEAGLTPQELDTLSQGLRTPIQRVGRPVARQVAGRSAQPAGLLSGMRQLMGAFSAIGGVPQLERPEAPSVSQVRDTIREGGTVERNDAARAIDAGYQEIGVFKNEPSDTSKGQIYSAFQDAISKGQGGSFILDLIRKGVI